MDDDFRNEGLSDDVLGEFEEVEPLEPEEDESY